MAWQDILGGLAGGLSQGLGQVQQNVEARRRSTLEERQQLLAQLQAQRAQEQQELQNAMAQYGAAEEGVVFDPNDPAVQPMIKAAGPAAFVKSADGKGLTKKRKTADILAEKQLGEFDADAPQRAAGRAQAAKIAAMKESTYKFMEQKYGPTWVERIPEMSGKEKSLVGAMLMGSSEALLGEEDKASVISSKINAGAQRDTANIYSANGGRGGNAADAAEDNRRQRDALFQAFALSKPGIKAARAFDGDIAQLRQYWEANYASASAPNPNAAATPAAPLTVSGIREVKR